MRSDEPLLGLVESATGHLADPKPGYYIHREPVLTAFLVGCLARPAILRSKALLT